MASSAIYHVAYLIAMWRKGYRKNEILFERGDFKLFLADLKFLFNLSQEPARFGRYNWREKFDYFGACFGVLLMVGTGLVIWFPQIVTWFLPGWTVTAAVLLHEYEALLAGLAIFLSHFYWVHFDPEIYPMSMVWLTGEITEETLKHHHPLEYEQVKARERQAALVAEAPLPAAGEEGAQ
jgi:cytochrome b subunit of formate dehydrogenase